VIELNKEQQDLIIKHMSLAKRSVYRSLAKGGKWHLRDDLLGAAYLGLCSAALSFDENIGVRFQSWARWLIDRSLKEECRLLGELSVLPSWVYALRDKVRRFRAEYFAANNRFPCDIEILQSIDKLSLKTLSAIDCNIEKICGNGNGSWSIGDGGSIARRALGVAGEVLLRYRAGERYNRVLALRYLQGATYREIGEREGGVSRQRACQLVTRAKEVLRCAL